MKLEEIKKMSDEEFISFIASCKEVPDEASIQIDKKATETVYKVGSFMNGIAIGLIPTTILDNFTDDNLVLGATFVVGVIAGIPLSKRIIKKVFTKVEGWSKEVEKQDLIRLKSDLEKLSEEELSFLIGIDNNKHIYKLNDRIKGIFSDDDPKKFIDSLEVAYKDDGKKFDYSKNIKKNN